MFVFGVLSVLLIGGLRLVWRYDIYNREPALLLVVAAVVGALAGYGIVWPELWLIDWLRPSLGTSLSEALSAGFLENTADLVSCAIFLCVIRFAFDDPLDGLVYGSCIGLGFGLAESFSYWTSHSPAWVNAGTAVARSLGHVIFGGLMGFSFGLLCHRAERVRRMFPIVAALTWSVAFLLHFAFDLFVFIAEDNAEQWMLRVLPGLLMVMGFLAYLLAVHVGRDLSAEHFNAVSPITDKANCLGPVARLLRRFL